MLNAFKEKRKETIEKKRLLLDGVYAGLRLSLFIVFAVCGSQTLVGHPPPYSSIATLELTFFSLALIGSIKLLAALLLFKSSFVFAAASIMTLLAMISVLLHIITGNSVLLGLLVLVGAISLAFMSKKMKCTWYNSNPLGA